uniref:Uncharacterized protein n=1 Tax=Candidatus Kentrum sp. LFY TaxID=2126342 RepID=A0A450V8Y5_9GAMM|nr:MAG: hypothetical protein BECKLFY1418A_GA0070994_11382 [Candidatus Kentron sp. LFY]
MLDENARKVRLHHRRLSIVDNEGLFFEASFGSAREWYVFYHRVSFIVKQCSEAGLGSQAITKPLSPHDLPIHLRSVVLFRFRPAGWKRYQFTPTIRLFDLYILTNRMDIVIELPGIFFPDPVNLFHDRVAPHG